MKKVIFVIFIFLSFSLHSQNIYDANLDNFIDESYLQAKSDSEMQLLYSRLTTALNEEAANIADEQLQQKAINLLRFAILEYYNAKVYISLDTIETALEKNKAERAGKFLNLVDFHKNEQADILKHLEKSIEYLNKIEKIGLEKLSSVNLAEFYAIKSEVISNLCLFKNVDYTVRNFANVAKNANKSLKANPSSLRGKIIFYSTWVYCPAIYGGKPALALTELNKIDTASISRSEDLFNVLISKAYCLARQNEDEAALIEVEKALKIYPKNIFTLALKKMILEEII